MSRLQTLYRDVVLEHYRNPRNQGPMADADRACAEGVNPLCGDRLNLCVRMAGDRVERATFEASGCAISIASASLLTESVAGLGRTEALALEQRVQTMLQARDESDERIIAELGTLAALSGVRAFPSRIRCATLAWRALRAILHGEQGQVTTESGEQINPTTHRSNHVQSH